MWMLARRVCSLGATAIGSCNRSIGVVDVKPCSSGRNLRLRAGFEIVIGFESEHEERAKYRTWVEGRDMIACE
jgi:hypothetical protein